MRKGKGYFIEGVVILIPFVLACLIISWLVDLFTYPLHEWLSHVAHHKIILKAFGFLLSVILITVLGFLAQWWILHKLFQFIHHLFLKIPVIRDIYTSCHKAITTLFKKNGGAFHSVVTFEYGDTNGMVIGIVPHDDNSFENHLPIIHTGPSPLHNLIFFVDEGLLKSTSIQIDTALRWSISAGSAPLKEKSP